MAKNHEHHRLNFPIVVFLLLWLLPVAALLAQNQPPAPARTPDNPRIQWMSVKQATEVREGQMIYVRAQIVSVAPPRPNSRQPYSIFLSDASGATRVVIFQDTWDRIADPSFIRAGARVDVFGRANAYQGERQIEIQRPNWIRLTPGSEDSAAGFGNVPTQSGEVRFTMTSIGALNMSNIGQPVRVRGRVISIEEPSSDRVPYRVVIQDATGDVEVTFWSEVAKAVAASDWPKVNEAHEFSGFVAQFRGKMQVRVDDPTLIKRPARE